MKPKKLSVDYTTLLKYICTALVTYIFSGLNSEHNIYSVAVFASTLFTGNNLIINILLHLSVTFLTGNTGLLLPMFFADLILITVFLFYKKYKSKMNIEIFAYTLLSLIPFFFLGTSEGFIDYYSRVYQVFFTSFLTLVLYKTLETLSTKGLKYKFGYEEYLFLIISVIVTGVGICNVFSPLVWKSISVFSILLLSFIYRMGITSLIASLLGLGTAIYYNDVTFIAVFLLLAVSTESMMPLSRYLSSCMIICVDYAVFYFFQAYGAYTLRDFFATLVPTITFVLIPTKFLDRIKDKLFLFREKQLTRLSINRNRVMLSNKLYDLSGVFNEIALAFSNGEECEENATREKRIILDQVITSVCKSCQRKKECAVYQEKRNLIEKIIDIGIAKGKLTLIDFPKELCENCIHSNNMLFALNKLLNEYKGYLSKNAEYTLCRNLLKEETLGVSEVLKGLALESGTTLKYQSKLERQISDELFKRGIIVSELLIYGEGITTTVSMVISMKEFSLSTIQNALSSKTGYDMTVVEKIEITDEKCYLAFKICAEFDAVFGLSFMNKDGSEKSGDTHTVTRIKDDKFLIALSDGMGSGEKAEKVSSSSLSLIETFYKAGLNNNLILTTINKLLSINCDDNFTALDVAVIDLKNCSCDFIKYGSPYGFIISKDGIKIVESSNLPLGILDDIKPSIAHTSLNDGDVILLCTDGISDSFGSSGDLIDFLRTQPALNPQSLSESILNKAVELSNGSRKDDMTVLAVRVFKKEIA